MSYQDDKRVEELLDDYFDLFIAGGMYESEAKKRKAREVYGELIKYATDGNSAAEKWAKEEGCYDKLVKPYQRGGPNSIYR